MLFETLDSVMLVAGTTHILSFQRANKLCPLFNFTYARLALDLFHLQQKNLNKYSLRNLLKIKSSTQRQGQAKPRIIDKARKLGLKVAVESYLWCRKSWCFHHSRWY